jgi:hypothetical protein
MKRSSLLLVTALVLVPFGAMAGMRTMQSQEEPNLLVISTYQPAPGQSFTDASAEISEWVRIYRNSGHYKSVRLFTHSWGSELALYMVAEPNDWASVPAGFTALLEAQPDLMDRPSNWQAHSDNILTEIDVN